MAAWIEPAQITSHPDVPVADLILIPGGRGDDIDFVPELPGEHIRVSAVSGDQVAQLVPVEALHLRVGPEVAWLLEGTAVHRIVGGLLPVRICAIPGIAQLVVGVETQHQVEPILLRQAQHVI